MAISGRRCAAPDNRVLDDRTVLVQNGGLAPVVASYWRIALTAASRPSRKRRSGWLPTKASASR